MSQPVYGQSAPVFAPPEDEPESGQVKWIKARDGRRIYVETWLPVAKAGGAAPPKKLPTVLYITPSAPSRQPP